jgi:small ligand-binding sensory domain FIST
MNETSDVTTGRFNLAHATADTWQQAARLVAEQLGDRDDDTLGFVYVTDHFADALGEIAGFLAAATGVTNWCGTVGIGVCATGREYFDCPAVVAMTGLVPEDAMALFGTVDEAVRAYNDRRGSAMGHGSFAIVHGDPRCRSLVGDIARLARDTDGFLVGGLTSSRGATWQMAGRPVERQLSGVMFDSSVRVATGLTQGCVPLGAIHQVTEADDNVVHRLDDRPAMDVFVEELAAEGIDDPGLLSGSLHVGLPVSGSDMGDYLVRNLIGIEPNGGTVVIGERVAVGDALMFCRRDRTAAEADLRRMLVDVRSRAGRVAGGLYFSCLARGPNMFDGAVSELSIVREVLGDVPLVGFFGNGEISFDRLYAYTGVLTLFETPAE